MNNNKTHIAAALLLGAMIFFGMPCAPLTAQAQRPATRQHGRGDAPQRPERSFNPTEFRNKVRQFITREAALTKQEADIVFPLFFELKDAQRELKHRIDNACQRVTTEKLSERDCQRILDDVQRLQRSFSDLEAGFYKKLRQRGIPASKILRIKAADEKFRRSTFRNATHGPRK